MSMSDTLYADIVERELFIELVADGVTEMNAGFEVGWTPQQTRRNLADPDFREIVDAARERADGTIEQALFKLAKNGNLGAQQMWLYNRQPERWKDVRRIEVRNDTTINIGVVNSTKQAVLDSLRELGPAALQPQPARMLGAVIEAEIVEEDGSDS